MKMYTVKIYKEEEISWEIQSEIHRLLNLTFKNKSQKFIAKTYANVRPLERIIYFKDEKPIAHLGIYKDIIHIGNITTEVTCLGLWCAINNSKRLATNIMKSAYEHLESKGVKFGIGVTSSQLILKYILPEIKHLALNVKVQGKNTASKPIDKVIFFCIQMNDLELKEIEKAAIHAKVIYLETEVF